MITSAALSDYIPLIIEITRYTILSGIGDVPYDDIPDDILIILITKSLLFLL